MPFEVRKGRHDGRRHFWARDARDIYARHDARATSSRRQQYRDDDSPYGQNIIAD